MRARVMIVPMGTAMRVLRVSGLECASSQYGPARPEVLTTLAVRTVSPSTTVIR